MSVNYDLNDLKEMGKKMISILGLTGSPVGVRLLKDANAQPEEVEILSKHRYCQALMKARHGFHVLLDEEGISCPAAAAAFGFRPLPAGLQSGKGLVGFGIVSDEAVGRKMFENMPRFEHSRIMLLHLYPLTEAEFIPDIIIVEDEIEKLMWIVLSSLHATGGQRVQSNTAVLQATCVDSTIIPYLEKRLNFGYGCYGCRDATDIGPNETVLGFSVEMLSPIMEHLEFLSRKAIPASRSKKALADIRKEDSRRESAGCESYVSDPHVKM